MQTETEHVQRQITASVCLTDAVLKNVQIFLKWNIR